MVHLLIGLALAVCSVSGPHSFHADPDLGPAYGFNADPDPLRVWVRSEANSDPGSWKQDYGNFQVEK